MYPLQYIEPVFRPPSESKSLILQVTNGCSWNKCTFCNMYKQAQKKFQLTPIETIEMQLKSLVKQGYAVRRVFLADGDAMALSTKRLLQILQLIRKYYPDVQRVSSYCLPRNLRKKSIEELAQLKELGLSLLYVGCETGDTTLLELVHKGETYESSLHTLQKIKAAAIKSSVMILNGLGGPNMSEQHAVNSAALMNAAQPEYLSTLVVEFPSGSESFAANFNGHWRKLEKMELFVEMKLFLQQLELDKTIFRSDHASNYLVLKGVLGKDKEYMLRQLELAIHQPGIIPLREEWQRGL